MEIEDIDRVVLNGFREEGQTRGCRASDVHGYFSKMTTLDILRHEIEESIDRLLELHLIEEVTEDMDWHSHYRPVSILEAIARASADDSEREDAGRDRRLDGDVGVSRRDVRRSRLHDPEASRPTPDGGGSVARAQSRRKLWEAVGDLLGLSKPPS